MRAIAPPATTAPPARRRASALVIVVAVSAIVMISVSSLLSYSVHQRDMITRREIALRELAAAERAVDAMVSRILYAGRYRPDGLDGSYARFHENALTVSVPDDFLHGYEVSGAGVTSLTGATPAFGVVTDPDSPWFGQNVLRMQYEVAAQVRETGGNAERLRHPGIRLSRTVQVELVPVYQYAIFYENTLELDAGQRIDVVGKVHANGDFYLTTSSEAWYHKAITVANRFYAGIYAPSNGRGNTSSNNINVTTNNGAGGWERVQGTEASSTQWLDSRYGNWASEALDKFNGYIKDRTHGVMPVQLPLPSEYSPRVIIEPADANDSPAVANQKFANFAALKITGDPRNASSITVRDAAGNIVPKTYVDAGGTTRTWVTTTSIYNGREMKMVDIIDVDAGRLREAVNLGRIDIGNGVVYVQPTQPTGSTANSRQSAARLSNARLLPSDPYDSFSFVSNAPVYTKGDVNKPANASDRKMVLIAGDSINVLSNNFKDTDYDAGSTNVPANSAFPIASTSTGNNGPNVGALPTETNAIFMGGNTPSDGSPPASAGSYSYYGRYSGGAENYFRYLESWGSSNPHTFNGTIMNLWQSEIAWKSWDKNATMGQQSSGYYGPPRRIWSWDATFATKFPPPHWPTFWIFNTVDWQIQTPEQS